MNTTAGVDADEWFLVPSIDLMTLVDANTNKYKATFSITEADAVSLFGDSFQSITLTKFASCLMASASPYMRAARKMLLLIAVSMMLSCENQRRGIAVHLKVLMT